MARGCRLCSDVRRADCGGCQWADAAAGIWGLALLQRRVQLGFVPNMTIFDTDNHWIIDRGNGFPSINLVVLSFVDPVKLMNLMSRIRSSSIARPSIACLNVAPSRNSME